MERAWSLADKSGSGVVAACPFAVYPICILKHEVGFEGELGASRMRSP